MNFNLKDALVKAYLEAEDISRRPNQFNTEAVKVGNFCTALRRELQKYNGAYNSTSAYKSRAIYHGITTTYNWKSLLEPAYEGVFSHEVRVLIDAAKVEVKRYDLARGDLGMQISNLGVEVRSISRILDTINSLNKEADTLLTGFRELSKQL